MAVPFPLDLPERSSKPRYVGLTHVLDKGLTPAEVADRLNTCGAYVDVWKFGWGTAYVDPHVEAKLAILGRHGVLGCLGGTLLEVAWSQRRVDHLLDWAAGAGFPCVEVSRGAAAMTVEEKHEIIRVAASGFTVLSEVGAKSRTVRLPPGQWAEEVAGDLAAGARWVLTEGRESGTVGIYNDDGSVREDVLAAVVAAASGPERLVFEAPRKDQQAWFVRRFGSEVNLANIAVGEVLGLETLRLGLRADTIELSIGRAPVPIARR
ncbi:MAG: phosphosulfolactate synthase [Actinomycetota bacterium]|jgi:phosphosulfolactate synthase|nr:phosphosulfolactate synthase [Actinomycetota bacterium]